jgi:two-component system sensor histidine kinase/response regulator
MPNNKTILIVEDDKSIAEALQLKLQVSKFNVLLATNGEQALNMVKKEKLDLILLDIIIPKMNGFDFLETIKKDPKLKDIKVIIMSNLGQEMDIEHGKSLGAVDYLVKSDCDIGDIAKKIDSLLA